MTQPITKETEATARAKIVMTRRHLPPHVHPPLPSPPHARQLPSPPHALQLPSLPLPPSHISPARQLAATMLMSVHRRACHAAAPASNSFIDYFIQIADFISAGRPLVGPYVVQNHSASGRRRGDGGGPEGGEGDLFCHALLGLLVLTTVVWLAGSPPGDHLPVKRKEGL